MGLDFCFVWLVKKKEKMEEKLHNQLHNCIISCQNGYSSQNGLLSKWFQDPYHKLKVYPPLASKQMSSISFASLKRVLIILLNHVLDKTVVDPGERPKTLTFVRN